MEMMTHMHIHILILLMFLICNRSMQCSFVCSLCEWKVIPTFFVLNFIRPHTSQTTLFGYCDVFAYTVIHSFDEITL